MPKGLQGIDALLLEKFREKVTHSLNLSLNSNKNYELFSNLIFKKIHIQISSSTLRRVFQYDSHHLPTKSTLDLISQGIGYSNWDDFNEKEYSYSQFELLQLISTIQLVGIPNHVRVYELIRKFHNSPDLFSLLDTIVKAAIRQHDIKLLSELFDLPEVFTFEQDSLKIYFFVHNLVIKLNQAGLMKELIPFYGASVKAQVFLIEWYVDEDHLDGYYYDLLQVYHKNKTNPEAQIFYNCLMYQHAALKKQSVQPWLNLIRNFKVLVPIHPIPRARRLSILMLQIPPKENLNITLIQEINDFFLLLNEDDKIMTVLIIVRMLFSSRKAEIITYILKYAPDIPGIEKNIWTRININQTRIYRAYSYLSLNEKEKAAKELLKFDSFLINNFIHNSIMSDYEFISGLTANE